MGDTGGDVEGCRRCVEGAEEVRERLWRWGLDTAEVQEGCFRCVEGVAEVRTRAPKKCNFMVLLVEVFRNLL